MVPVPVEKFASGRVLVNCSVLIFAVIAFSLFHYKVVGIISRIAQILINHTADIC